MGGKEKRRPEKEKKKGKGGRVQIGKRMPAGKKAVARGSSSGSSDEMEGDEELGQWQVSHQPLGTLATLIVLKVQSLSPV